MKTTLDSSFQKIHLIELYLRNVGANLFGFFIIALLNFFTPLEFFKIQRAFLRQRSSLPGNLADIVSDVNRQMTRDFGETGSFMTLFYLTIDTSDMWLYWVRAGHDPAILYDPETDNFEELRGAGVALGVDADGHFEQFQKPGLKKGQVMVLGSDGLWEARNPKGEMFGKDPIHQIIRQNPKALAREMLTSSFNTLNAFLGDRAPEDDVTLVVIKITKD